MLSHLLFLILFRLLSICRCLLSASNKDLCMNDVVQIFPFLKQICHVRLLHNKNMSFLQGLLLLSHLGDLLEYLKLLNCMVFLQLYPPFLFKKVTYKLQSLNVHKKQWRGELLARKESNTWDVISYPPNVRLSGCKCVYSIKLHFD